MIPENGLKKFIMPEFIIKSTQKVKGKSDGITILPQRSNPLATPERPNEGININRIPKTSIKTAVNPIHNLLDFFIPSPL